jgi:hypothetical protein
MNSFNSKRLPIGKLFGKLRSLIALAPQPNSPHRSWDRASSREIQLEFDFELRKRVRESRSAVSVVAFKN